jgi:hypothetical protein
MVSPIGQQALRADPQLEVICLPCAERWEPDSLASALLVLLEDIMESDVVPNLRRHRN